MGDDNQSLGTAQPEQRPPADVDEVIAKRIEEALGKALPDALNSALSEFERRQQSARDKMLHKINQRFEQYAELLRSTGAEITPDMERKIRDRAESEVRQEFQSSDQKPGQESVPPVDDARNVVGAAVEKILASFGVTIEDGDPEAAMIASSRDAAELLANVAKAAKAKAERVSQQKPAGGLPLTTGASPASNPLANLTNPDDIWQYARQSLRGGK